jgi:acetyl esterase/lipase
VVPLTVAHQLVGDDEETDDLSASDTWGDKMTTAYDPQMMLDRGESVSLPPLLIMQDELDDNVLPPIQEKFAAAYRAAGGECQLEAFAGCEHMWVKDPGPQTDRAIEMVKAFIASQLHARRLTR